MILADEMGLGKTVQSVSMVGFLQVNSYCYVNIIISSFTFHSALPLTFSILVLAEFPRNSRTISCCGAIVHAYKLGQGVQEVAT